MARKIQRDSRERNEELAELMDQLDRTIERCKVVYEQYFMGIQKTAVAASQLHRTCERQIRELTQANIRNTALRFRLTTLTQKFGSYNTYWRRTLRLIEQGRYIRDIARVKRQAERTGEEIPAEILAAMPKRMRERIQRDRAKMAERAADLRARAGLADPRSAESAPRKYAHQIDAKMLLGDLDLDSMAEAATKSMDAEAAQSEAMRVSATAAQDGTHKAASTLNPEPPKKPAAPPPIPPARRRAGPPPIPPVRPKQPARPLPPGMSEEQTRDLYARYVQARSLVGESNDKISYDKLVSTLNKQAPRIMEQHKAKGVDFSVVIKNDKVILKAKPKK